MPKTRLCWRKIRSTEPPCGISRSMSGFCKRSIRKQSANDNVFTFHISIAGNDLSEVFLRDFIFNTIWSSRYCFILQQTVSFAKLCRIIKHFIFKEYKIMTLGGRKSISTIWCHPLHWIRASPPNPLQVPMFVSLFSKSRHGLAYLSLFLLLFYHLFLRYNTCPFQPTNANASTLALKSKTAATMVGGPKYFGRTKELGA